MKKLCIFDFDGTLVDTFTDAGIYYNKALEKYNFPVHPVEEYKYLMGGTLEEVVTRILPENCRTEENINNVKNEYWSTYPNSEKVNTKPYLGIVVMLEKLKKSGIILAVNTNKKQEMVEKMCQNLFPTINFEMIVGNNGNILPKPSPDGVNIIINKFKIDKKDCVYIGDSKYDIETAQNADIDVIVVTWGSLKKDEINLSNNTVNSKDELLIAIMK